MLTLMVFVWIGAILPNHFKQVLKDCENRSEYKCLVLQEIHFIIYFEKYKTQLGLTEERIATLSTQEKEDLLKLLYLYDRGGIYSDLDNQIDYDCLNTLQSKNQPLVFGYAQTPTKKIPNNNFIYTPAPKSPQLKRIINNIRNCPLCTGDEFAGKLMLARQKVNFVPKDHCYHKKPILISNPDGQFTIKDYIKSKQFLFIAVVLLVILFGGFFLKKYLVGLIQSKVRHARKQSFQAIQ